MVNKFKLVSLKNVPEILVYEIGGNIVNTKSERLFKNCLDVDLNCYRYRNVKSLNLVNEAYYQHCEY